MGVFILLLSVSLSFSFSVVIPFVFVFEIHLVSSLALHWVVDVAVLSSLEIRGGALNNPINYWNRLGYIKHLPVAFLEGTQVSLI